MHGRNQVRTEQAALEVVSVSVLGHPAHNSPPLGILSLVILLCRTGTLSPSRSLLMHCYLNRAAERPPSTPIEVTAHAIHIPDPASLLNSTSLFTASLFPRNSQRHDSDQHRHPGNLHRPQPRLRRRLHVLRAGHQ